MNCECAASVTGHDASGRAVVKITKSARTSCLTARGGPGRRDLDDLPWFLGEQLLRSDAVLKKVRHTLAGGTVFRVHRIFFPPASRPAVFAPHRLDRLRGSSSPARSTWSWKRRRVQPQGGRRAPCRAARCTTCSTAGRSPASSPSCWSNAKSSEAGGKVAQPVG